MGKTRLKVWAVRVVVGLFLLLCPIAAYAENVPSAVMKATDSVVLIDSGEGDYAGTGTGFIVYKNARSTYFATNYHVVEGGENSVYVWTSKSNREKATVIAKSELQDLAVIRIDVAMDAAPLILSADYKQGEGVYAIGFPALADVLSDTIAHVGSEATITNGLISSVRSVSLYENSAAIQLLQINADINPGNSGGPLLNAQGLVVGINAYGVLDAQGINGAVGADELISLINTQHLFRLPHAVSWIWYVAAAVATGLLAVIVYLLVKKAKKSAAKKQKILLPIYLDQLNHSLDVTSAVGILMHVALELKHMHEQGSVFLRLYPGGLSMSKNGCIINNNQGTPSDEFVAPEQKAWAFPGVRTDIYAFCAVLRYVLRFCREAAANPREVEMRVQLEQVLKKGLSELPEDRFQDMQELIAALAPYNTGISEEALKPFVGQRTKKKKEIQAERSLVNDSRTVDEQQEIAIISEDEAGRHKRKGKKRGWWIATAAVLLVAAGFAFNAFYNRNLALEYMDDMGFVQGVEAFGRIPFGDKLFPTASKYVSAGELALNKKYSEANIVFESMGDYRQSKTAILETKYRQALADGQSGRFKSAKEILYELIDQHYEPAKAELVEVCKLQASNYAEKKMYDYAYKAIKEAQPFGNVDSLIAVYSSDAYEYAVNQYHSGNYTKAQSFFEMLGNYHRSDYYLILIRAHLTDDSEYLLDGYSAQSDAEFLMYILGFEDAEELLVSKQELAEVFLLGNWRGDGYYFTMREDGDIQYNLPVIDYGNFYFIEDGELLLYPKDDFRGKKAVLRFTVISRDCIWAYCYKNSRSYTLYRQ